MVEDKLRVLDGMRRQWHDRLTTVFVRQGHYANDPSECREYPPAQVQLDAIADLCRFGIDDFPFPIQTVAATE